MKLTEHRYEGSPRGWCRRCGGRQDEPQHDAYARNVVMDRKYGVNAPF